MLTSAENFSETQTQTGARISATELRYYCDTQRFSKMLGVTQYYNPNLSSRFISLRKYK